MTPLSTARPIGLKERILTAASHTEIDLLLKEGATYKGATDATRRSWQRAAALREQAFAKK